MVEHLDSLGRELKPGQVCVHFFVMRHAMASHAVVVRELKENGNISVDVYGTGYEWVPETGYDWSKKIRTIRKSTIKVPEYLTIVDMTEEELRAKYGGK